MHCTSCTIATAAKQPSLKLKFRSKQLLGYLPLTFAFPGKTKLLYLQQPFRIGICVVLIFICACNWIKNTSPTPLLNQANASPWKPYQSGRISTVDLTVLTNLDQPLLILKNTYLSDKTSYLNEEVNGTVPSSSVWVPWIYHGQA